MPVIKEVLLSRTAIGGGLTAGPQSGLVKFAVQLKAANGDDNPALIGSFHVYARESEASSRLASQIKALKEAGYKFQIGEVGNANLTAANTFQQRTPPLMPCGII